jgi:hypothetical protein
MTYTELVQDALKTIDSTETELEAFCDTILAEKQIQIPTPEDWQAFHAYHDRIKMLRLMEQN